MSSTVKQKIQYGTLFLFAMLLIAAGIGLFHIFRLKKDANIILENNYESIQYVHAMLRALDSMEINGQKQKENFDTALRLQEKNITEPNELQLTGKVRSQFEQLVNADTSMKNFIAIRSDLNSVLALNMHAIEVKNQRASVTATKALTYISLIAGLVFVIGFSFVYNFPSVITEPINAFTDGIREITNKNYHHRIRLQRTDEFGQMANAFNDMAERLEYFESSNLNQIIFQKTRAEAVINSLKDASIGIDKNGVVLFANDQALQLLNLRAADIVAKPVSKVSEENDLFRFLLAEDSNIPFKIVVDNRENYFVKELNDIMQPDGQGNKLIVLRNVTSFKELDVAKTNFIATISHELKTPLASSDFSLKLLEDTRIGVLTTEQHELVLNLRKDNQRMLRILSELLNMAQVETGRIQLDIGPASPYDIFEQALQMAQSAMMEKQIRIIREFPANLPMIKADQQKTEWVVNNFLINAVKHSKEGAKIVVALKREEYNVIFSVTDEGPGIQPEHQSRIFEKFYRVPGSDMRGTGLGLAISKEFIDAQHGSISVESAYGQGSVFAFKLPSSD